MICGPCATYNNNVLNGYGFCVPPRAQGTPNTGHIANYPNIGVNAAGNLYCINTSTMSAFDPWENQNAPFSQACPRACVAPQFKNTVEGADSCVNVCPSGMIAQDGVTCVPVVNQSVVTPWATGLTSGKFTFEMFPCLANTETLTWVGPHLQCKPSQNPTNTIVMKSILVTGVPTAVYSYPTPAFVATAFDNTNTKIVSPAPVFVWSVGAAGDTGAATINPTTGVLTGTYSGYVTVFATSGTIVGSLTVAVVPDWYTITGGSITAIVFGSWLFGILLTIAAVMIYIKVCKGKSKKVAAKINLVEGQAK
jgi:hypothetical protein